MTDHRELVHECYIQITLSVFDHLRRLGGLDTRGAVDITTGYGAIDLGQEIGDLRAVSRDYLDDAFHRMGWVSRVDPLR